MTDLAEVTTSNICFMQPGTAAAALPFAVHL